MQNERMNGFAAVILLGAVACQKNAEPSPPATTESVSQSAKPAAAEQTTAANTAPAAAGVDTAAAKQLEVGDPAPSVTLALQNGKTVELASLKGQQIAVYFYPKDDTPGCTVEAQGIRDQWEAFQKAGVKVFGVSMQDAASHTAFIQKYQLPFDLVVDHEQKVTAAFGVPVRGGEFAARQTFLIGADGKIKQVWREVNPPDHAKQLLEAAGVSSVPAAATAGEPKAG